MSLLNPPVVSVILLSITFVVAGMLSNAFAKIGGLFHKHLGSMEFAQVDGRLLQSMERRILLYPFLSVVPLFLLQVALVVRIMLQNFELCPPQAGGNCVYALDPIILFGFLILHLWLWIAQVVASRHAGSIENAAAVLTINR